MIRRFLRWLRGKITSYLLRNGGYVADHLASLRRCDGSSLARKKRREFANEVHEAAYDIAPGWPIPAQYTTEHVLRYHELLIDVGLADAYNRAEPAGDGSPIPEDARVGDRSVREAMRGAHEQAQEENKISREQAQKIRQAFIGELDRLNLILLEIDESKASDVPTDVTLQALERFVPVYAAVTSVLIGTGNGTA
jgi:hypothetical protein